MPVYANTNMRLLVDSFNLSGHASSADFDVTAAELVVTTIDCNGWVKKIPGIATHSLAVYGFQDFDTTGVDIILPGTGTGQNVYTFCPQNAGDTVADTAFLATGRTTTRTPLSGAVGDAAAFALQWAGDGRIVQGQVLHPLAARTVTGTGTITTFTAPTAAQSLWATFHVTSVSGAGTITFTVQTDDAVGFGTPTTRITSSAFAAVGAQFTSLAGALAGETHIRTAWTIAGFTSVTFLVAAGVN